MCRLLNINVIHCSNTCLCFRGYKVVVKFFPNEAANLEPVVELLLKIEKEVCPSLTALHCIALHCIALHCIALHGIAWHSIAFFQSLAGVHVICLITSSPAPDNFLTTSCMVCQSTIAATEPLSRADVVHCLLTFHISKAA